MQSIPFAIVVERSCLMRSWSRVACRGKNERDRKKERKSSVERQFPSCWTLRDAADAYFWIMGQIALVTMAWKIQQHSFCTSSFSTAETSWLQADDSSFPRQMLLRCANNTFPTLLWRIMQASCEWILPPLTAVVSDCRNSEGHSEEFAHVFCVSHQVMRTG